MRDAFHLVLSMPTRTDPLSVQRAARDFATREFSGFQYAMVLHTFETDPDPQPVSASTCASHGESGGSRRDPLESKERLICSAGARGLRRPYESMALRPRPRAGFTARHMNGGKFGICENQHDSGDSAGAAETHIRADRDEQQEVMRNYEQVMRALARSERGDDRQLAVDLVRYLRGRGRTSETDRERGKDRER
jgi:hypothetical protein